MYERLKKIGKRIIPKRILRSNEQLLRKLIALRYRGNRFHCNVCTYNLSSFVVLENNDQLCPHCGSLSRTRRLWSFLHEEIGLAEKKVLHFSPPPSLKASLEKSAVTSYITTDYEGEFRAMKQLNIEAIDEPDNTYNLIICYHVLEHIINDTMAMLELYRILKPKGQCIIQTPFKEGDIYEDYTITAKEDRLEHFGQADHVRIYSVNGLKNRLEDAGFSVQVFNFATSYENKFGFQNPETTLVATKI